MMTVPELAADALGDFLGHYMRRRFGSLQTHLVEMMPPKPITLVGKQMTGGSAPPSSRPIYDRTLALLP